MSPHSPITVSLCMIVKNEEEQLEHCLRSTMDLVDEIILVDTGSTDGTKEIGRKYTAKIFDYPWVNDFSKARNFSFQQATKEYLFWLDADDILLENDQQKFKKLKTTMDPSVDAVSMIYHYALDDQGKPMTILRRNRLVKQEKNFQWVGAIHEYLDLKGKIMNSDVTITHNRATPHTERNLLIFEERIARGELLLPRDLYFYANELRDAKQYEKAIAYYEKFLDTKQEQLEEMISSCHSLAECYFQLGNEGKEREWVFKSFEWDTPRAEFCCRLGYQFLKKNNVKQALFWYQLALQLEKPQDPLAVIYEAFWTWLPHVQLSLCYLRLGDRERAKKHIEIAYQMQPDHPYIQNVMNHLKGKG